MGYVVVEFPTPDATPVSDRNKVSKLNFLKYLHKFVAKPPLIVAIKLVVICCCIILAYY